MSGTAYTVRPSTTVALAALGAGARAATVEIDFAPSMQVWIVSLDQLRPDQALGPIGTVYVDNSQNAEPIVLTFPDTQARYDIPAGAAPYILGITGGQQFTLASAVATVTRVFVQVLNRVVTPTGIQALVGPITIDAGTLEISNPGPINGNPVSRSANIPAAATTVLFNANAARKYIQFAMPQASDGWVNYIGGAAGPALADCFHMQAGEKYESNGYVPAGQVSVYVTSGGEVPAIEG